MKKNNQGLSLILALWIVLFITSITILLLEYIIPFSRGVRWLENITKSYYLGMEGVEESLYYLSQNPIGSEKSVNFASSPLGSSYTIIGSGSLVPAPLKWESDFDSNWWIISEGNPIQIYLPLGINWSNVRVYFRVPNIAPLSLQIDNTSVDGIINWQLVSPDDSLNSDLNSRFDTTEICSSQGTCAGNSMNPLSGTRLWDLSTTVSLTTLYSTCANNFDCVLKFSIIAPLKVWGKKIPYLEYRIDFWSTKVPYSRVEIQSSWKSYGFRKEFIFDFPIRLINEAFDFTVFQ